MSGGLLLQKARALSPGEAPYSSALLPPSSFLLHPREYVLPIILGRCTGAVFLLLLRLRRRRRRCLFHAPLLHRHAVVLVPALLPVALLAPHAAVEGAHAAAAGLVGGDAGDSVLCGAAVGAVLEGGRGGAVFFFLLHHHKIRGGVGRIFVVVSVISSASASPRACAAFISFWSKILRHRNRRKIRFVQHTHSTRPWRSIWEETKTRGGPVTVPVE